jgi:hypothetical protein
MELVWPAHFTSLFQPTYFDKIKEGFRDHLAVCESVYPSVSIHVPVHPPLYFLGLWDHLTACVSPPLNFFVLYAGAVSYDREVGD